MSSASDSRVSQRGGFALLTIATFVLYGEVDGLTNRALFSVAPALFWIADLFFYSLVPVALLVYLNAQLRITPAEYGLRSIGRWGEFLGTTFLFVFLLVAAYEISARISWIVLYRTGFAELATPFFSYHSAIPAGLLHLPAVAYLAVSAGLLESILFIGLPWLLWREWFGGLHGGRFAFASSVVFASVHWEQGALGLIGALVFGLVACRLYLKIGDLWPIVAAHTLVDFVNFW
jgi:hypothetical protein